ncbi:hypothetical protein ACWDUD_06985 [Rhodococcus sp. NPDC003382]
MCPTFEHKSTRSILEGEPLAIEMGIDRFRDRDLHILTDSLLAVAARRCHEANVSPDVAAAIADNIVESLHGVHSHSA